MAKIKTAILSIISAAFLAAPASAEVDYTDAASGVAVGAGGAAVGFGVAAKTVGAAAVAHSSGAAIATVGGSYVAGTLGSWGAGALALSGPPGWIAGGVIVAGAGIACWIYCGD